MIRCFVIASCLILLPMMSTVALDLDSVKHGEADSAGVKIHYVHTGKGPLLVMIHGFPDYWYSWRDQIPELAKNFHVVAVDQRGYNKSGQPEGVENYTIPKLVADIAAVIKDLGEEKATILGHDWGGMVAWTFAMAHPNKTERLIILNLPHPRGLLRELRENPKQVENSQYARNFQLPGAEAFLTAEAISGWVKEPEAREKYIEAFKRSSIKGMLNYYKANYPRPPYEETDAIRTQVKCPVLVIHGLDDTALLDGALDGTWRWIDNELTLVTIPGAGHFVHRDKPKQVTSVIAAWLSREHQVVPDEE
jgi:pimeloyl-ACP methyl ester carboxylesterase